ncbi:uncharacterized protein TNCV_3183641 [Trichonephila clavipes]|uniref:Uncharacterized protein n=1 Tax=Trichonephila clavipes TaxID=2585209 RepID=A0A8X6SND7_TRICX|nr:uncharacterized protein TNCV_3183641 [Trichonephila clavipes]
MNRVVLTEYNGDQMISKIVKRKEGKAEGKRHLAPTTSGYNLRPRIGKREESRQTIERKIQQGGPVRSRKDKGRNNSPYIEERTRSSNKNARRGGDQQRSPRRDTAVGLGLQIMGVGFTRWILALML